MRNKLLYYIDILMIIFLGIYIVISILGLYDLLSSDFYLKRLLILSFSIYVLFVLFIKLILRKKIKYIEVYILFYSLYYYVYLLITNDLNFDNLLIIMYFPLVFLTAYFSINNNTVIFTKKFFYAISYYSLAIFIYVTIIKGQINGIFINSIYYTVISSLFVLLVKNNFLKYLWLFIILIVTAYSSKRTALIAVLLVIILEFFKKFTHFKDYKQILNYYSKISTGIILLGTTYYLITRILNFEIINKILNVVNDGGSGRTEILNDLFTQIKYSTLLELFFGHGINSTNSYTNGYSAHNDFVEVIFNFGIVGFLIYMLFWLIIVKYYTALKRVEALNSQKYLISLIMFLIISLFSNIIFVPTYLLLFFVFWNIVWINYKK